MEDIAVMEDLYFTAAVESPRLPAFSILAYTGGVMKVPAWGDIAIDLSGLDLSGSVAILSDHNSTRAGIVGHGRAQVMDGRLVVAGSISAATQAAREIVDAAKNGFPWQASVGVEVLERRQVSAGQHITVNGRTITAPQDGLTFIAKGRLREVSIMALGSDASTSVAIAASIHKGDRRGNQPGGTSDRSIDLRLRNRCVAIKSLVRPGRMVVGLRVPIRPLPSRSPADSFSAL